MMKHRRQLTPAEMDGAKRLLAIWTIRKEDLGLTQEIAAEHLGGITQGAVHQYLHGVIPLGISATIRFARLLGVQPDEIRPDLGDLFKAIGPIRAKVDADTEIQLSPDEAEWIYLLRRIPAKERKIMQKAIIALADNRT